MGTNTLTNRIDGQVISQSFFNDIHSALNGVLVPRNSSGIATDLFADFGSTSYRWNDGYLLRIFLGAIASGISFEDDSGDLVFKRNSLEVGRFTANGMDASDLVDASITLAKMAANSVGTSQIVNANVTLEKMAASSVDESQLITGSVTNSKLGADSVTTVKILDSNCTLPKLGAASAGGSTAINQTFTASTSDTQFTNGSVNISITNSSRPIFVTLRSSTSSTLQANAASILLTGAGTIFSQIIFKIDGTTVANIGFGGNVREQIAATCFSHVIASGFSTGTRTIAVHGQTDSATTMQLVNCQLFVYQV